MKSINTTNKVNGADPLSLLSAARSLSLAQAGAGSRAAALIVTHTLYMPDGETVSKSNMTLGQAIEAIAFAHIKAKMPHLADSCDAAKIEFKNGKFIVSFADTMDNLSF